jgi:hypothetical protein
MLPVLLRFSDLKARRIVHNRPQLKNLQMREGFPLGRWMSANSRVWTEEEVIDWIESRPEATENKPVVITEKHVSRRTRKSTAEAA